MNRLNLVGSLCLVFTLALAAGCSGKTSPQPTTPPGAANVNLVFVVSPDLAYQTPGDVNPQTANLTNQGLQRSLRLATYLKKQVLGGQNAHRIYALEPMSHLQTPGKFPDMAALGYIQQFAVLNEIALPGLGGYGTPLITANSYPINAGYAAGSLPAGSLPAGSLPAGSLPAGSLPAGVAAPLIACPTCQGLDFNDTGGSNQALVARIIASKVPGFYVFSAPWETASSLMANINQNYAYNLVLPAAYAGSNIVYSISVTPSGSASLAAHNSNLNPPATYPELPSAVGGSACTPPAPFTLAATGGVNGAKIPAGINTNETVYMVRHAEAHPSSGWDNGNYLAAGQWRALALHNVLQGRISPSEVYSIDPAQATNGGDTVAGSGYYSYVRAALTVEPYAIANNLPFYLVSEFELLSPDSPKDTSDKFFTGGAFSNKTILLAWEHSHFPPIITSLLASYFPPNQGPKAPGWPVTDYDTIWTVTLDDKGNVTVNNALCEGIDTSKLPAEAPQY